MKSTISSLFAALAVVCFAATSQAALIEFTSPDYSDAALDGQQSWVAEANWNVADSAGAGNTSTTSNGHIATLNDPITLSTGESFRQSINLEFGGTYATPTGFVYTFMAGLRDAANDSSLATGSAAADANIQIVANTDTYRLLSNFGVVPGASGITGTTLDGGDILQYDYTLTLGADAASTTYDVRLQNLTDGTDTGTGTVTGIDASIFNALTGAGAYGFFQRTNAGAHGSGLTYAQVNSYEYEILPAVIPEPTTIALLGLGALALVARRRS